MSDDVVAELDAWLEALGGQGRIDVSATFLRRARDEIVALQEYKSSVAAHVVKTVSEARAEALEEAARVCKREEKEQSLKAVGDEDVDADYEIACARCAAAIRALKDKPLTISPATRPAAQVP
jgi:C4-dicarboxylate-specific signal transduction histidine kinase